MSTFETLRIEDARREPAPDGSRVQVLLRLAGGSMARFTLPPGAVSAAVEHPELEEIWYVLSGHGQMWRAHAAREEVVELRPHTCLTIPARTRFQFRAAPGNEELVAIAVTMPPWTNAAQAVPTAGPWGPAGAR